MAVLGPGIVCGFADNDAGGITTYSIAGAKFGYQLLWVMLVTQIALLVTQEIGARLGLATGQGLTGLIRERFGLRWAAFAAITMIIANLGSTVSEFAGIAAALSLFGIPAALSALLAAVAVMVLIGAGSFSRVQYGFVAIGVLVSGAYLAVGRAGASRLGTRVTQPRSSRRARSTARTCSPSSASWARRSRRGASGSSRRMWSTSACAQRT